MPVNRFLTLFLLLFLMVQAWSAEGASSFDNKHTSPSYRKLKMSSKPWTGDFNGMLKRRMIRIAIPYSRTLYYIDKGQERGLSAELSRDFEQYLNKKYKNQLKNMPVTVIIFPLTRDKLLQSVVQGHADIATGNLTITEKRQELVDFVPLEDKGIDEVLVTGPTSHHFTKLDDLAGRTVHVRPSSSYHESLLTLNKHFVESGKPPVKLALLPDAIEDEDKLEMLNAGMFDAVIMDDWKARVWAQLLPNIKIHDQIVVRSDSHIGWAVRMHSPQLQKEIRDFFGQSHRKLASANRYKSLMKRVKGLRNNTTDRELQKFGQLVLLFEKYGKKYQFDPLLLTALGFQESRLDQNARSHVGAVGIMQLMPRTGAEMKVGNIRQTEPNIHAGSKYLDLLIQRYFADASFDDLDRALFSFAAYNAGPGNIAKIRKLAKQRGLNPNIWFNNVEIVAAEKIGSETTTYVRNIYKYYAAYKLVTERQLERQQARQTIH